MGKIIDGKALSQAVKDEVKEQVPLLEEKYGRKPCLVVIIVGENPGLCEKQGEGGRLHGNGIQAH